MKTRFLESVALLVGSTIGAGILGIPYIISQSGFWTGILVIIALGIATLMINLYTGEIVLRTKGNHQLTGYAEKYTGNAGKRLTSAFMIFGIYGALTAYIMGVGQAAATILNGEAIIYSIAFFITASLILIKGIRSIGKAELLITTLLLIVILAIPALSADNIRMQNLNGFDMYKIMIPYGVILFAFIGMPAIPTMKEELNSNRKALKKAIIIGTLIPIIVYILFATIVVGVVGDNFSQLNENQRIATVALSMLVKPELGIIANILAILTMSTSFLGLSFALSETFRFDYRMKISSAYIATLSIPLTIFLINLLFNATSFIKILAITGSITGGILGILIVIMHYRSAKNGDRKPEYAIKNSLIIGAILSAIFLIGIINELITIFS